MVPEIPLTAVTDEAEMPPVVDKEAADIAPDTERVPKVPTAVMLGCAAVARVPVMGPATASPLRVPTEVMLGCTGVVMVPIRLPPGVPTVVAVTVPANRVLVTTRLAKVPISVMLGCDPTLSVPLMMPAVTVPAVTVPVQFKEDKVPTEVILG